MRHFAHNIGDYAAATRHLSFIEDAAYRRLLDRYYQDERALPADVSSCCRLVGARTKDERAAVAAVLAEFFALQEDGYHQSRADREISNYREKAELARRNGTKGGRPPNRGKTDPVSSSVRTEKLTTNHEPITNESEPVCVTPSPVAATATHTARLIPDDWEPSPDDLAMLRKGRPDLVGDWYETQMAEFRDWCRSKAVTSHDFAATWRGFMRKAKAPPEARTYARKPGEPVPFMGTAEPWEQRLRGYRPGATWWKETDWGPRPETGRCRAPKELVERYLGSAA